MATRLDIAPIVITYNEAPNIARVLDRLSWADEVLVVDSGSTDETLTLATAYANVRVVTRLFDTFAGQCNFALEQVSAPWVLSLDADYVLSPALEREIEGIALSDAVSGYQARFVYQIGGRSLRGSLYPPRTVLYRRDRARYRDLGHGHRVEIQGAVWSLENVIYHDDRKSHARWLASQESYACREAEHLLSTSREHLTFADRLRLGGKLAPLLAPLYALVVKGAALDGAAGWEYARQRRVAEQFIARELRRRRRT